MLQKNIQSIRRNIHFILVYIHSNHLKYCIILSLEIAQKPWCSVYIYTISVW